MTRYRPEHDEEDADRRRRSGRATDTAGTGGSATSMSVPASPPGSRSRVTWRSMWATRERQEQEPDEHDEQPALDRRSRGSASGAGSCPLELPVEDRDRADVPLAHPGGELLGDDDRAVEAAGAADRDRQAGLALGDVGRARRGRGTRAGCRGSAPATGWPRTKARTSSVSPDSGPELGDVERVLHEPDVEDEVGLERQPVLEAEADELDGELVGPDVRGERAKSRSRSWRSDRSEVSRTTSDSPRTASSSWRSSAIELAIPRCVAERMAVAGLAEPPDQDVVARLEEDDPRPDAAALERAAHRREGERRRRRTGRRARSATWAKRSGRPRRARPGRAAAHPAGCRRPCSRGPRTAWRRRSCRPRTGR